MRVLVPLLLLGLLAGGCISAPDDEDVGSTRPALSQQDGGVDPGPQRDGGLNGYHEHPCAPHRYYLCHRGNTLCLPAPAMYPHKDHGDTFGPCP